MIPREHWPSHPRYPAQTLLLGSHQSFRNFTALLLDKLRSLAPGAPRATRKRARWTSRLGDEFEWFISGMKGHERYEETKLYPYLAHRWGASFDGLMAAHRGLGRRVGAVRTAFRLYRADDPNERAYMGDLLAALEDHRTFLLEHLAEEESIVIPMLLELSPEEFDTYTATPIHQLLDQSAL